MDYLRNFYLFRINCYVLGVRLPLHLQVAGSGKARECHPQKVSPLAY